MPIHGSLYYDFDPGNLTHSDFEYDSDIFWMNHKSGNLRRKVLRYKWKVPSIWSARKWSPKWISN